MDIGTGIVLLILAVIIVLAICNSRKHLKGEGGCCGGGGQTVEEHKELDAPAIGEKIVYIEGMHCDNCKNRVEHAINRMEGAVGKVNLKKNLAYVRYSKEISEEELIRNIERLDFKVSKIESH